MKTISLSQGKYAIVDDWWYDRLMDGPKWFAGRAPHQNTFYAKRHIHKNNKRTTELMHRVIAGVESGQEVDHKDGNGLNNLESNLRSSTRVQNGRNRGPQRNNRSGFKGVSWHRQTRKWQVHIKANSKRIYLGLFTDKSDAAIAYDEAALKYHGEFARLNFPVEANTRVA
jgi:hypothetical protein